MLLDRKINLFLFVFRSTMVSFAISIIVFSKLIIPSLVMTAKETQVGLNYLVLSVK